MTPWLRVLLLNQKNQSSNLSMHISSLKNIYNQYGGFSLFWYLWVPAHKYKNRHMHIQSKLKVWGYSPTVEQFPSMCEVLSLAFHPSTKPK